MTSHSRHHIGYLGLDILAALDRAYRSGELGKHLGRPAGSVRAGLRTLERAGLVARWSTQRDPLWGITDAGVAALADRRALGRVPGVPCPDYRPSRLAAAEVVLDLIDSLDVPRTARDLSEETGRSYVTVTRYLARLERDGLARPSRTRAGQVWLRTPRGAAALAAGVTCG